MKSFIALIAAFISLNLWAFVNPVEQEYTLDNPEALEFGFPHYVHIESVEIISFSKPLVRVIGKANGQPFDLTKTILRMGPTNNGMIQVKTVLWEDTIGAKESCHEAISKEFMINFRVAKRTLRTSSYSVSAFRYVQECEEELRVREYSYSLNK